MLRLGVLGAGHLGKIHMSLIQQLEGCELVGVYDPIQELSEEAAGRFGVKAMSSEEELIAACDAVDIVASTSAHADLIEQCVAAGRHVFVEKPLCSTAEEARRVCELMASHNLVGQVGHVERFNPAFLAVRDLSFDPLFIETHRLAEFNPRGTDVSVIHDLMIHDLDIILKLVKGKVSRVSASGVALISDNPDIANARIEFDNGCVANLTASRISLKRMRRMRIFQKNAYITMDFGEKQAQLFSLSDQTEENLPYIEVNTGNTIRKRYIRIEQPQSPEVNSILMELECFRDSILNNQASAVSFEEGLAAVELAEEIIEQLNRQLELKHVD
jgi:predicted dehydrogenase